MVSSTFDTSSSGSPNFDTAGLNGNTTHASSEVVDADHASLAQTYLLNPRAVPVWALKKAAEKTSKIDVTDSAAVRSKPSTNALKTDKASQQLPLSTSETVGIVSPDKDQSRWKDFVEQSHWPDQKITQGLLQRSAAGDNSSAPAAGMSSSATTSLRSPEYIHSDTKRRIISVSELEKQMDLNGLWNPAREHEHGTVGRDGTSRIGNVTEVPALAMTAAHHFSHDQAGRRGRTGSVVSGYSSGVSVASQFHMTAELTEKHRKERWQLNTRVLLLDNPYVPLTLRSAIFVISIGALGLAVSVFRYSKHFEPNPLAQQPSTIMAICVQTIGLIYLLYITYDEYSGKPLGLRDAKDKVKLLMLDLLFIILSSANLSLTFNTLYDKSWICQSSSVATVDGETPYNGPICRRQKGLASFLFLVLIVWVMTFTISIFRVVERVSGGSGLQN